MKKILSITLVVVISVFALFACGNNVGATSAAQESHSDITEIASSAKEDAPPVEAIPEQETEIAEPEPEPEPVARAKNVKLDDYFVAGIFDMDGYAKALGYNLIAEIDGYWNYTLDKGGRHYYISSGSTNFNVFYQRDANTALVVDYADVNPVYMDEYDTLEVRKSEKTFRATELWIEDVAYLLNYLATTDPQDVDLEHAPTRIRCSAEVWYGTMQFDSEGKIDTDAASKLDIGPAWKKDRQE